MTVKLSKKIRAKIDSHPTHSELVAWAEAAERLEKKVERQIGVGMSRKIMPKQKSPSFRGERTG